MKKHIPNFCTSMNLFSGCIACVLAFEGAYLWVAIWVIIGAIFDFFDGFMARVLNAPSPIGKELDSLADQVTFGMAPSFAVFNYLLPRTTDITGVPVLNYIIPFLAFVLAVFSALRLAKFNVDERQSTSFIGLPTPANALFWVSYIYGIRIYDSTALVLVTIGLIFVFSYLLIAEIPMFSLKVKKISFKGNELRFLLVIFMLVAFIFFQVSGIAAGIVFYILLSLFSRGKYN